MTAPAARSRATTVASTVGTRCSSSLEEPVVRTPAVSNRSLYATGMPCRGPRDAPWATACLRRAGLGAGLIRGDGDVGAEAVVDGLNTTEEGLGELDRGELAALDEAGCLADRQVVQGGVSHGTAPRRPACP